MFRKPKIGLALGGGGARGIAHVGVLAALAEEKMPIHVITGTSFGAIIGALYALEPDVHTLGEKLARFLQSPKLKNLKLSFMNRDQEEGSALKPLLQLKNSLQWGIFYGTSIARQSFISEEEFTEVMGELVGDAHIEDAKIPLRINAVDLATGQEVVMNQGPLREALCATCAIPGFFPPVKIGDQVLMDGGWVNPIPITLAKDWGADVVIGVDTSAVLSPEDRFRNGLDLLARADSVARTKLSGLVAQQADMVICPDVGHVNWADFSDSKALILKGQEAAKSQLADIRRLIAVRRFWKFF